ncbi:MAG: hypothetical protein D6785_05445, partial [Planctomycetota bacterium]
MELVLNERDYKIFQCLQKGTSKALAEIIQETSLPQSQVMAFAVQGEKEGWLKIHEEVKEELMLREGAPKKLPERILLETLGDTQSLSMSDLAQKVKQLGLNMKDIMKWGRERGWFESLNKEFVVTEEALKYLKRKDDDEKVLEYLQDHERAFLDELVEKLEVRKERVLQLLKRRNELVKIKERKIRSLELVQDIKASLKKERSQLTPEEIESGAWREALKELKPYNVALPAKVTYPAKIHPLQKIFQETRKAFLHMGFEEIVSPYVETAFWDFDALFQPQDHPARDMQDTFYL